jgi:hypothetical protein
MNTATTNKQPATAADWVNIGLGMWMAISPAVLGFSRDGAAMWNNVAVGVAIVLLNLALLGRWGNGAIPGLIVLLGIWLFMSPFVLGFLRAAFLWNNLTMTFVVIGGAAISEELRSIASRGTSSRA